MELIQQYGQQVFIICAAITGIVYALVRTVELNRIVFIALHLLVAYPASILGLVAILFFVTEGTGSIAMSALVVAFVIADARYSKPKNVLDEVFILWRSAGKTKMAV